MRRSAGKNRFLGARGQSMSELATFGSLILVALAIIVRYGLQYNHRQQMQMDVFRRALTEAYVNGSSNIQYIKDFHIPDPQDMFGMGSRTPFTSQASISWTNATYIDARLLNGDDSALPRIKYVISGGKNGIEQEYKIAGYGADSFGSLEVEVLGEEKVIPRSLMKVYEPVKTDGILELLSFLLPASEPPKELQALILPDGVGIGDCTETYCPTDIIKAADVDNDDSTETILKVNGSGSAFSLVTLDNQNGDIDPEKMGLNVKKDNSGSYQGYVEPSITTTKDATLMSSGRTSYSTGAQTTVIDYQIRTNNGVDNFPVTRQDVINGI